MIKFHYRLSTNNLVVSIFKTVDDTVITGMTENMSIIGLSNSTQISIFQGIYIFVYEYNFITVKISPL